jgi:AcrR family transcriptional regulator
VTRPVSGVERATEVFSRRPMRADARRNYDKLIAAAHDALGAAGAAVSLEDIARRARVGIGTLYRHFPTRRDLFEGVYVDEVQALCRTAEDLAAGSAPWEALVQWLRRFVVYVATRRVLAGELVAESELFRACHAAIHTAGGPLLVRAQQDGCARVDVGFDDVLTMFSGIMLVRFTDDEQVQRVLGMALDGMRPQPSRG